MRTGGESVVVPVPEHDLAFFKIVHGTDIFEVEVGVYPGPKPVSRLADQK